MNEKKDLSEDQKIKLAQTVRRQMAIADSTSGHDPLTVVEKTKEEQRAFNEKFFKHFSK